ncbi:MAG: DUF1774 domain-containing protein [Kocuria palustris]|jgi:hypothetical protein|nr:DUF1774 domain-containing protein [Kocuria palustris]
MLCDIHELTPQCRIFLLLSQLSYVWHLFSKNNVLVTAAANVATHFILNNLFLAAWILLWTRNHFWGAEIILIAHFINQAVTYWRHRGLPAFVHLPAVAGPYAWTLTALFWNGAVAVHSHNLPGRIVANIFIWVILAIGLFDIVLWEDYILGYCLSWLTLCKSCPFFYHLFEYFADIHNSSTRPQTNRYQDHCPAVDLCLCCIWHVLGRLSLHLHDQVHWP